MKDEIGDILASIVSIVTLMIACVPINGALVMFLWNYAMPGLGFMTITWVQSMALYLMCALLFKSPSINSKDEKKHRMVL